MSYKNLDNQENINVPKRIKISDNLARVPIVGRRTVLGALNPTSNVRIQPRRAAKQGIKYEKQYPRFGEQKRSVGPTSVSTFSKSQKTSLLSKASSNSNNQADTKSFLSNASSSGVGEIKTQSFLSTANSSVQGQVQKRSFLSNSSGINQDENQSYPFATSFVEAKKAQKLKTSNIFCQVSLPHISTSNTSFAPLAKPAFSSTTSSGFSIYNDESSKPTFSNTSSGLSIFNDESSKSTFSNTISSGFTIYSDVSSKPTKSNTTSSGFTIYSDDSSSLNTQKRGLLPPSSFTLSQSSISENSNDKPYLSNAAAIPSLPMPLVSKSTTLSDCIKQTLRVSDSIVKPTSVCDKENDYFKTKLVLPDSLLSDDSQEDKPVKALAKVTRLLSSKKLTRCSDYSLREEVILNRRKDSIWAHCLYPKEIYSHLRLQELKHRPKPNYMQKQAEITSNMRWILIDWLVEVASEYNLYSQTLYLAVSYVDRFLSFMSVKRDKLQLVGTTAMFIAAKYEEIYPPEVKQFAEITDSTYRISQIIKMEQLILRVLNFDVSNPTILDFTENFAKMCHSDDKTTHLCQFIAELSMLECEPFLKYSPSMIAAAALALANHTLELPMWPEELRSQCGYELHELKECYLNLNRSYVHIHEIKSHAIREKYRANDLHCVSDILPRMVGYLW